MKPTNAVSATRNTLNGSTKNSRSIAMNGPPMTTRTVSATAATNVAKLAGDVELGRESPVPDEREQRRADEGKAEDGDDLVHALTGVTRVP